MTDGGLIPRSSRFKEPFGGTRKRGGVKGRYTRRPVHRHFAHLPAREYAHIQPNSSVAAMREL